MIGKLTSLQRLFGGEWSVTITTREDLSEQYEALKEHPVAFDIKKANNRRSRDANAFAWVLIDKIAERMNIAKSDVYKQAIREIGGVSTMVCVQNFALDRLRSGWEKNGLGWQTETMPSKRPGCTNVVLYYGSSTYDTAQMSRLIDLLIQEAEQLGIPTLRDEADALLGRWEKHGSCK